MAQTIRNERRKLVATMLAGVALSMITAGIVLPIAQVITAGAGMVVVPMTITTAGVLIAIAILVLGSLEDDPRRD